MDALELRHKHGSPRARPPVVGPSLALLAAAVLLIAGLSGCGASRPSAATSPTGPGSTWVRVGSLTLPVKLPADHIGPLRLRTGHVRFVVRLEGHPGAKALLITGFLEDSMPSPGVQTASPSAAPYIDSWWFGHAGVSVKRADTPAGTWTFAVEKASPLTVTAKVTIYELR